MIKQEVVAYTDEHDECWGHKDGTPHRVFGPCLGEEYWINNIDVLYD